MKKLNKKGFTLAELLIVIAIIAILIAIAIPAFSASLYSARLQTDHANIRSAYAVARTADMLGVIDSADGTTSIDVSTTAAQAKTFAYMVDGTIVDTEDTTNFKTENAYKLKVTAKPGDCTESLGCGDGTAHKDTNYITIKYTGGHWQVVLGALS